MASFYPLLVNARAFARRLFKRKRAEDTESTASDSSSSFLPPPPPPPFNSPASGSVALDESGVTPRSKSRRLRLALEGAAEALRFAAEVLEDDGSHGD